MIDRLPAEAYLDADDFLQKLIDHLPEGEVWPRDPDAPMARALSVLAATYARLNQRDSNLLVDVFPLSTEEMLVEWEASLGLPDPCTPLNATLAQRIAAVAAKVIAQGGQTVDYLKQVAAAIGVVVTITEIAPFRVGVSRVGERLYSDEWAYTLIVNAPKTPIVEFRVGHSAVGDPLASWGNAQLECVLNRVKPAHVSIIFTYGS